MTPMKRLEVCYHEAGHGIVAWRLGGRVSKIVIDAEGEVGRIWFDQLPTPFARAVASMAGAVAQKFFSGDGEPSKTDIQNAGDQDLEAATEEAERVIDQYWDEVEALAFALWKRGEAEVTTDPTLDANNWEPWTEGDKHVEVKIDEPFFLACECGAVTVIAHTVTEDGRGYMWLRDDKKRTASFRDTKTNGHGTQSPNS